MAKQTGPYGFRGKIGDVVGRQINGQLVVGKPGGFTKETWKNNANNPDYAPRKEASEFASSSSMAKEVYRICDLDLSTSHRDPKAYKRLVAHFQKFRILDRSNPKGKKRPSIGAFHHLTGFAFNTQSSLFDLIMPPHLFTGTELSYEFPGFQFLSQLPTQANTIEFIGYAVEIDFKNLTCINRISTYLTKSFTELSEHFNFTINSHSKNTLYIVAIRFYDNVSDYLYPLSDRFFSPMRIVAFKE
ncbi:hypothetical protein O3Q51_15305 [Cryomorphaceae bacterium 1068]|nr:hypothetical protein [Cryomorphaceae bacterium 1068]